MAFIRIKVCRALCSVYLFLFILQSLFYPPLVQAQDDISYRDRLIAAASDERLADDRYWDILVHYRPEGSGRKSLIDDPRFFLSAEGKTSPSSELNATIAGLFMDTSLGDEHPQCRFVARFAWLRERLNIDVSRLPPALCAKYQESMANVSTRSATLVFPAAHGNGPASMFGHTLIRIESPFQSELLTFAVNYAADAKDTNGFLYTFKGIFGFYRGLYSILPYYVKVNEYNHIEHRDMWEYALNLSEQEVGRMVMHIWELKDVYSDYYFFTENCSYNLLFLLEAARPSVHLTDQFTEGARFWVIPSDTVRVVAASGLVSKLTYRPSLATRIKAMASRMNSDEQGLAVKIADDVLKPDAVGSSGGDADKAQKTLDLAAELVQYRYSRGFIEKEKYLKKFLPILRARSALAGASDDSANVAAPSVSPDHGHFPGRIGAGTGRRGHRNYGELSWRAAYHDLMDPSDGYVEGAQINFFDIHVRQYIDPSELKLQTFRLLDIISLAPRDLFFNPVSWKVMVGFDRSLLPDGRDHLVFRLSPGGGAAYQNRALGLSFLMMESDLQLSRAFEKRWSAGIGLSGGMYRSVTPSWRLNLSAKALFYPLGDTHRSLAGVFRNSVALSTNTALDLNLTREKTFNLYRTDATASLNFYY